MIKKSILNSNLNKKIFNLGYFIFLFNMINREFKPFIDLRYLMIILSFIFIFINIKKKFAFARNSEFFKVFLLYFVYVIISLNWLKVNSYFNENTEFETIKIIILYSYNFIIFMFLILGKDYVTLKKTLIYLIFSILINFIGAFDIYIKLIKGKQIYSLFFSNILGYVDGDMHRNFYGQPFRISSYSEDANYLTMNAIIVIILMIATIARTTKKDKYSLPAKIQSYILGLIVIIGCLFLIGLSGSKTMLIAIVLSILIVLFESKTKQLNYVIVFVMFLSLSLLSGYLNGFIYLGESMRYRFIMWERSLLLLKSNPFLGGGITSFRHLGNSYDWVVHPHNGYIQVVTELGLVGALLYSILISKAFNKVDDHYLRIMIYLFLIASLTYDYNYLSYFSFYFVVIPLLSLNDGGVNYVKKSTKRFFI